MKRIFLSLIIFQVNLIQANHTISIIGTGYVGLITGACIADLEANKGINVICTDIDSAKISLLNQGMVPIYEPGLQEIILRNTQREALCFSDNIPQAIKISDIIFVTVGTPTRKNGETDLTYFENSIQTIAQNLSSIPKTIIIKSTVPIGTCEKLYTVFDAYNIPRSSYELIFNPEFLREGTALLDFLNPDRIVIGVKSEKSAEIIKEVYQPLIDKGVPFIVTDLSTAETIKYAANNFLAIKLSFINEMANLCQATGSDISIVSYATGLDKRINHHFFNPGPGFGGSCLPKDTAALLYMAKKLNVPLLTVDAAIKANKQQKLIPFKKLAELLNNNFSKKTIAILGLSFKANTDDIRYSAAIPFIKSLLKHGAHINAYDPAAINNMKQKFPDITYCSSAYEAIKDSDALVLLTEWEEFKELNIEKISSLMREKIVVDMRNILSQQELSEHNFTYYCIAKKPQKDIA